LPDRLGVQGRRFLRLAAFGINSENTTGSLFHHCSERPRGAGVSEGASYRSESCQRRATQIAQATISGPLSRYQELWFTESSRVSSRHKLHHRCGGDVQNSLLAELLHATSTSRQPPPTVKPDDDIVMEASIGAGRNNVEQGLGERVGPDAKIMKMKDGATRTSRTRLSTPSIWTKYRSPRKACFRK
jgi:hypothetical protein